jgi:hypothetical protein
MSDDVTSFSDDDEGAALHSDSSESTPIAAESKGFWRWLRDHVFAPPRVSVRRLEALTQAIEREPQTVSNYVLRGELLLAAGYDEEAENDFAQAVEIAGRQFEKEDWGLLSQALRDQAEMGLEQARRKLGRKRKER